MGFFDKLKTGLNKTKESFNTKINNVFSNFRKVDEDFLEELEEVLIMSDMGVDTSVKIVNNLRKRIKKDNIKDEEEVKQALREEIKAKKEELSQVTSEEDPAELAKEGITKKPDGTYQAEITDKDGNKKTLKSNDLIDLRGQILLASQSDDNLIA